VREDLEASRYSCLLFPEGGTATARLGRLLRRGRAGKRREGGLTGAELQEAVRIETLKKGGRTPIDRRNLRRTTRKGKGVSWRRKELRKKKKHWLMSGLVEGVENRSMWS